MTADTQGNRLPNQALDVEVFKYSWENKFIADANGGGQWQSRQVQTSVAKQTVTTDAKAEAVATFTPAEGGSYRVVASARDGGGRTVRSSLFVWVAGTGYVSWRRENNDRFSLIADNNVRYTKIIADEKVHSLPEGYKATRFYLEVSGSALVQRLIVAETRRECRVA